MITDKYFSEITKTLEKIKDTQKDEILKAAEDVNMKWVVVEQDRPSMNLTPMECAKASIDYLKSI